MNEPKYKNSCVNPLWVFLVHDKNNDFYYCKENATFYRVFGMGREEFNSFNACYKPWETMPAVYVRAYQLSVEQGLIAPKGVTFEQMEQAKSLVNGLNIDQVIELVEKIYREGVDNFLNTLKCLKKLQM